MTQVRKVSGSIPTWGQFFGCNHMLDECSKLTSQVGRSRALLLYVMIDTPNDMLSDIKNRLQSLMVGGETNNKTKQALQMFL